MNSKCLENMLNDIFKDDPDSIKAIRDIEVPDMNTMMEALKVKSCTNIIKPVFRAKRNKLAQKKLLTAAGIIILIFIVSIFYEAPYAKAFKLRIVKTLLNVKDNVITIIYKDNKEPASVINNNSSISKSLSIEQVKDLPFHLYIPKYLPDNYKLSSILWKQYPDNMNMVQQIYAKDDKNTISIIQTENRPDENSELNINSENSNVEIIDINGLKVTLISTDGNITNAIWYKGSTKFETYSNCDKNETISIIKSLK